MLTHLNIRHYAIIDELELDLDGGLTALTGETGAGKSILLGALGLVLGDRADSDSVKQGHRHAEINAEFDVSALPDVSAWLVEQELNVDDECMLRRRVSADGRSRAFINGTPVNLSLLRELGEMLIDIHGQHEHQSIMKPVIQRRLLDDYAAHRALQEAVSDCYVRYKLVEEQLAHLSQSSADRSSRIDLLRFQTRELDTLELLEGEYATLNRRHALLANADKLLNATQESLAVLDDNDGFNVSSELNRVHALIADAAEADGKLAAIADTVQEAIVNIDESVSGLRHYSDNIDIDPGELSQVESRLQAILDIARKHQVEPDGLDTLHQQLLQELDDIDHADERLQELQQQHDELVTEYRQHASRLSKSRASAAKRLGEQITDAMQTLGMSGGRFEVSVEQDKDGRISAHGIDNIRFDVTANAGQDVKPLSRVASGGELARISLAMQMITASQSRIPTLIFDEVDSGVGGGIAEIVGQQLRRLGDSNQVMCITHLAQVASQAHHHFKVQKSSAQGHTTTEVLPLDDAERVAEIARMLSGVDITKKSMENAEEMIQNARA